MNWISASRILYDSYKMNKFGTEYRAIKKQ